MKSEIIGDYLKLIKQFLDNEITAIAFEFFYLRMYKNDDRWAGEELYEILNDLFHSADEFVSDLSVSGEGFIDENTFRKAAKFAYQQLNRMHHT